MADYRHEFAVLAVRGMACLSCFRDLLPKYGHTIEKIRVWTRQCLVQHFNPEYRPWVCGLTPCKCMWGMWSGPRQRSEPSSICVSTCQPAAQPCVVTQVDSLPSLVAFTGHGPDIRWDQIELCVEVRSWAQVISRMK